MNNVRGRAIVFDVDGTLLRSAEVDDQLYRAAIETVIGRVRFRNRLDDYTNVTDSGILTQVFSDNGIDADDVLVDDIRDEFVARVAKHVSENGPFREFPGAREFLGLVAKSREYSCAIATGGWEQAARLKLQTAAFDIRGIPLASADDAIARPEIMRHALGALDAEFASVTYFGDGPWDRAACAELGWQFRPVGAALGGLSCFAKDCLP